MDQQFSQLDTLFHRLAVVNAKLHETCDDKETLSKERFKIMELITRERLGQSHRVLWRSDETPAS